jgi:hypothetical protein
MRFLAELGMYSLWLGVPAFLVGAGLAYALGTSGPRAMTILAGGCVAVAGLMLLLALVGGSECYETCADVLGSRVNVLVLYFFLPAQVIGWIVGAALGWALRRVFRR